MGATEVMLSEPPIRAVDLQVSTDSDQDLSEVLEDLDSLYKAFYGTFERTRFERRLYEDPRVIQGLQKVYEEIADATADDGGQPNLDADLQVLKELEERYSECAESTLLPPAHRRTLSEKTTAIYTDLFGNTRKNRLLPPKHSWTCTILERVLPILPGSRRRVPRFRSTCSLKQNFDNDSIEHAPETQDVVGTECAASGSEASPTMVTDSDTSTPTATGFVITPPGKSHQNTGLTVYARPPRVALRDLPALSAIQFEMVDRKNAIISCCCDEQGLGEATIEYPASSRSAL